MFASSPILNAIPVDLKADLKEGSSDLKALPVTTATISPSSYTEATIALVDGILVIPEVIIMRVMAKARDKQDKLKRDWDSLVHYVPYFSKKAKLAEIQAEINYLLAAICYNELRILQSAILFADSEESRNNAILNLLRAVIVIAVQQKFLTAKELEKAEQHLSALQNKVKTQYPPVNLDVEIRAEALMQKKALFRAIHSTRGDQKQCLLLEVEIKFYEAKLKLHAAVECLSREQLVKDYNIDVDGLLRQMLSIKELLQLPFFKEDDKEYSLAIYFFESGPGVKFKNVVGCFGVVLKEILDQKGIFAEYGEVIVGSYESRGLIGGSKESLRAFLYKYPELFKFFHDQLALNILQKANAAFCVVLKNGEPSLLHGWKAAHPAAVDIKGVPDGKAIATDDCYKLNQELTAKLHKGLLRTEATEVSPKDLAELEEDLRGSEAQLRVLSGTATAQLILRGSADERIAAYAMSASDYTASTKPLTVAGGMLGGGEKATSTLVTVAALQEEISRPDPSGQKVLVLITENFARCQKQLEIRMHQASKSLFQEILKGAAANQDTIIVLRLEAMQAKINYFAAVAANTRLKLLGAANGKYLNLGKKLTALDALKGMVSEQSLLSTEHVNAIMSQIHLLLSETKLRPFDWNDPLIKICGLDCGKADADLKGCVKAMADYKAETERQKQTQMPAAAASAQVVLKVLTGDDKADDVKPPHPK